MSIEWGVNSLTLKEDTKKLGRVLSEAYLLIGENAKEFIPKENISLSKAVNFIAECQKGTKNISEFSDAVKIIKEHIKSNTTKNNIFENVDLNTLSDTLIQEFNLKYSDKLNTNETTFFISFSFRLAFQSYVFSICDFIIVKPYFRFQASYIVSQRKFSF